MKDDFSWEMNSYTKICENLRKKLPIIYKN